MTIKTNSNHLEAEHEGDAELVMVSLTYTGNRSTYTTQAMRDQGGYPALDSFRGPDPNEGGADGETKIVYIPSRFLGWWEGHSDFDVDYTPETIAEELLSRNYISEQIVGPGYDARIREDLIEKLGIDGFGNEEDLREKLYRVAGYDDEEADDAEASRPDPKDRRKEKLETSYTRSVLIKAANSYDDIDSLLEDEGVDSVSHLGQTDLASFLSGKPDDEVDRKLSTAEQGGEL